MQAQLTPTATSLDSFKDDELSEKVLKNFENKCGPRVIAVYSVSVVLEVGK